MIIIGFGIGIVVAVFFWLILKRKKNVEVNAYRVNALVYKVEFGSKEDMQVVDLSRQDKGLVMVVEYVHEKAKDEVDEALAAGVVIKDTIIWKNQGGGFEWIMPQ